MRLNAIMAVITVACVVAVVSSQTLGAMGRLHHAFRGTVNHGQRLVGLDFVDVQETAAPLAPDTEKPPVHKLKPRLVFLPGPAPVLPPAFDPPERAPTGFEVATFGKGLVDLPLQQPPLTPPPKSDLQPLGAFLAPAALTLAAPEPSTWAMMVLGFGAVALALRRRRRSVGLMDCGHVR
jgi:hypothetical protein